MHATFQSSDHENANERLVVVRYFLDRAGYGLQQSSARIWKGAPVICKAEDIRAFLDVQGIKEADDEKLLAEVFLDKYECYMMLDALDADVVFDFSNATTGNPGVLNFRLTDLSSGDAGDPVLKTEQTRSGFCTLAPLGLFAFSLTVIMDVVHLLGNLVENSINPSFYLIWGPYAFFVSGVLQIIAGLVEASRNNIYGGTAFLAFGCFWLATSTKLILTVYFPDQIPEQYLSAPDPVGDFFRNFYIAAFVCVLYKQTLIASKLTTLLIGLLACKVFAASLAGWSEVLEWIEMIFAILVSLVAFYIFGAEFTNEVYQREVFNMHRWNADSPQQIFAAAGRSSSLQSRAVMLRTANALKHTATTFRELRSVQPAANEDEVKKTE
ncbi:GPR1/FUN34/yaaH family [Fragilaria crotonensis]|nr:GPR1/FUN34/yaaH family [Fragilaria crotonensis]